MSACQPTMPTLAAVAVIIEGERDDICSVGQTLAAHDLCRTLTPYRKQHHLQAGVGHYGVFAGKRWERQIYPRIREFIHAFDE